MGEILLEEQGKEMQAEERLEVAQRAAELLLNRLTAPRWIPQPHQIAPPGNWYGWLLLAGRGAGKTAACSAYISEHVNGPPCIPGSTPHWIGIIGPTLGDAVTACYEGPSGLKHKDDGAKLVQAPGGTVIRWPNGSQAKLFGADEPKSADRLRAGGNLCCAWLEELAAWRYLDACWDQLRFGLRSGKRPHWIASTTPKPKLLIKKLYKGDIRGVVRTEATMYDNPYLEQDIKDALEETYAGTSLGAQELYGRLLEEDENALWKREHIERGRLTLDDLPKLIRKTVGVDPSGGAGEQGIVVTAKSELLSDRHHGYVLADASCHLSPDGWGRRAVQAAIDWEADDICVEINYGGDQAKAVLVTAMEKIGVKIPIRKVRATTGKAIRAQPVSMLAEQERWHHVGTFEALEDQLTTWYPELGWSPDRLDGMVWGPWHMRLVKSLSSGQGSFGSKESSRIIA